MTRKRPAVVTYDTQLIERDMADRGWLRTDLARAAAVSDTTVMRFLRGQQHNARTAQKLAIALGWPLRRYIRVVRRAAVA